MNKKHFFLGNIKCLILLVLYMLLCFFKNDIILIFLFFYSLVLGFKVIKNKSLNLYLNDSVAILLIFIFLYGFFNPIVGLFSDGEISPTSYLATIIYASTIPAYIIGSSLVFSSNYDLKYLATINSKKLKSIYSFFLIFVLVICLTYVSYGFYSQGILFRPSVALKTSRLELFTEISQLKIVISLLITSGFLYFIYYYRAIPYKIRLIFIFLLAYYVTMQLSVGNRRDFVPMIAGFFWVFVNYKKIKFTIGRFIMLLVGLFMFLFLGTLRVPELLEGGFSFYKLAIITLSNNEFVYPFETLTYSVGIYTKGTLSLYYGLTIFLYPLLYFIPRVIFPLKPISLAVKFVNDIDSGMGYAYSPVTDFFVNFGILGPVVCFFLLGMFISKVQGYKDKRIIFIFFTMIPDFCRGEIAGFIYQFVFVSFFVITMPVLLNYISEKRKVQS